MLKNPFACWGSLTLLRASKELLQNFEDLPKHMGSHLYNPNLGLSNLALSAVMEICYVILSVLAATSYMWLSSTWDVASRKKTRFLTSLN